MKKDIKKIHKQDRDSYQNILPLARRLRAKFWPDCAIPDTSLKFGTVVDHNSLSRIG